MKRVAVVTKNAYLGQKIRLALAECAGVDFVDEKSEFDLCFWDVDTVGEAPAGVITMSREGGYMLSLPFSYDQLRSFIADNDSLLSVDEGGRFCTLRGKKIKLTELEGALLSLLVSAEGEFVSRERILGEIWGGNTDPGIINVYIHYLREKLENGEKIIIASRGSGYRIDNKFSGGKNA